MKTKTKIMEKVQYEMVEISPEAAERFLSFNKSNRRISIKKVREYAEEMKSGNWLDTGDTIKFDINGNLLDGQHRLKAVILSQKTIHALVIRGLAPESFKVMDQGKKRSSKDVLETEGYKFAQMVASIAGEAMRYFKGAPFKRMKFKPREILEFARSHEGLEESALQGDKIYTALGRTCNRSIIAALYYISVHHYGYDRAIDFFKAVTGEIPAGKHKHIGALRSLLVKNHGSEKKVSKSHAAAWWIKSLNAYLLDRPAKAVRFRPSHEKFPMIIQPKRA